MSAQHNNHSPHAPRIIIESATLAWTIIFKCNWPIFTLNELCAIDKVCCCAATCGDCWRWYKNGQNESTPHLPPSQSVYIVLYFPFLMFYKSISEHFLQCDLQNDRIWYPFVSHWTGTPKNGWIVICKVELISCAIIKSAKRIFRSFYFSHVFKTKQNNIIICAVVWFNWFLLCGSRSKS